MFQRNAITLIASLAGASAIAAFVACSSGNGNAASCNGSSASSSTTNAACEQCAMANCGSQSSAFESGCSDFVSCECAADGSAGALSGCESKFEESNCQSAYMPLEQCEMQNCSSQCQVMSTTTPDAGATTPTGNCATLATCCAQMAADGGTLGTCTAVVDTNDDSICMSEIAAFQDGGLCH